MAAVSVVPAVLDALVAQATSALPSVQVYDGYGVSTNPGDYLMIGVDDPDNDDWAATASVARDFESVGGGANNDISESGDISLVAMSVSGDGVQKTARDNVYAIAEAVANICRTNPTLGVSGLMWVLYGSTGELQQVQDQYGAAARLDFQIHFEALI